MLTQEIHLPPPPGEPGCGLPEPDALRQGVLLPGCRGVKLPGCRGVKLPGGCGSGGPKSIMKRCQQDLGTKRFSHLLRAGVVKFGEPAADCGVLAFLTKSKQCGILIFPSLALAGWGGRWVGTFRIKILQPVPMSRMELDLPTTCSSQGLQLELQRGERRCLWCEIMLCMAPSVQERRALRTDPLPR